MKERIAAHLSGGGDLFVLFYPSETGRSDTALGLMQLKRSEDCVDVASNLVPVLRWCRVTGEKTSP